ncbi:hypothetical protein F4813DRAFT_64364 [Daldinia decipiens]|uniref:uncharacterized protein n=1 Tax=Daldinia decipiens TaxID=326647 RepID=UPI0020C58967|nr:uncharacterized protein F4813DRAFT_64364 [Daldinia decipiens]KAI1657934.1 hypothetical protein F4813DRAFT_64364 [Daldinia decipiens]
MSNPVFKVFMCSLCILVIYLDIRRTAGNEGTYTSHNEAYKRPETSTEVSIESRIGHFLYFAFFIFYRTSYRV